MRITGRGLIRAAAIAIGVWLGLYWGLVAAPIAQTQDWGAIIASVRRSVVEVEDTDSRCTGVIIHTNKRNRAQDQADYVMTAAHCDGRDLTADRQPATVVSRDTKHDLLVIEIEDTDRPALRLAKANPAIGDVVMSFGYGYGLDRPMARWARISDDKAYIPEEGIGGPLLAIDAGFVAGQSGGPVVNAAGEIVMIVQFGTPLVGFGRGADDLRDRVGRYFEQK